MPVACVVCDKPTPTALTRCTNGACIECHRRFCSPGGSTSPGHGINIGDARAIVAREREGVA
jgi:hypothetical protein